MNVHVQWQKSSKVEFFSWRVSIHVIYSTTLLVWGISVVYLSIEDAYRIDVDVDGEVVGLDIIDTAGQVRCVSLSLLLSLSPSLSLSLSLFGMWFCYKFAMFFWYISMKLSFTLLISLFLLYLLPKLFSFVFRKYSKQFERGTLKTERVFYWYTP